MDAEKFIKREQIQSKDGFMTIYAKTALNQLNRSVWPLN